MKNPESPPEHENTTAIILRFVHVRTNISYRWVQVKILNWNQLEIISCKKH